MMICIEHLSLPRNCAGKSLYIASFNPHNCFVKGEVFHAILHTWLREVNIPPTCYEGRYGFRI